LHTEQSLATADSTESAELLYPGINQTGTKHGQKIGIAPFWSLYYYCLTSVLIAFPSYGRAGKYHP
jgi:hypothetical protein